MKRVYLAKYNRIPTHSDRLLLTVFLFMASVLAYLGFTNRLGYTIAETLMNYSAGFCRRSLIGNFFVLMPGRTTLIGSISLLYAACLVIPLVIVNRQLRTQEPIWRWLLILFLVVSPFGLFFFVKNPTAVRKDVLFYGLFLLVMNRSDRPGRVDPLVLVVIVAGSLIHESFLFLFLPFLLSYLYLNGHATVRVLTTYGAAAILTSGVLFVAPGNSAARATLVVDRCIAYGMAPAQFETFVKYQSMSMMTNLADAFQHIWTVNSCIYIALFVGYWLLIGVVMTTFGLTVRLKNSTALQVCLGAMGLMTLLLSLIAFDYGRWLSMLFTMGTILIVSQASFQKEPPIPWRAPRQLAVLTLVLSLVLVVRIPHFTYQQVKVSDWIVVDKVIREFAHVNWPQPHHHAKTSAFFQP